MSDNDLLQELDDVEADLDRYIAARPAHTLSHETLGHAYTETVHTLTNARTRGCAWIPDALDGMSPGALQVLLFILHYLSTPNSLVVLFAQHPLTPLPTLPHVHYITPDNTPHAHITRALYAMTHRILCNSAIVSPDHLLMHRDSAQPVRDFLRGLAGISSPGRPSGVRRIMTALSRCFRRLTP